MADQAILRHDHERLFHDLGRDLGIEGLGFNEAGICLMSFDDVELRFEYQELREELLVTSVLGAVRGASAEMLRELLVLGAASMAAGGGGVGLNPNGDTVIWFDRVTVRGLGYRDFHIWLEAALARVAFWRPALERLRSGARAPVEMPLAGGHYLPLIRV